MFSRRSFICRAGAMAISSQVLPLSLYAQSKSLSSALDYTKTKYSGKSLTILYPKGSIANVKIVADSFYKRTGVNVILKEGELTSISSELILDTKLRGADKVIDVAIPATYDIPDLVENQTIIDLSSFAKRHEPGNFRDGWLYSQGDYYQGNLYGYQTDGDVYLAFYNQEVINKYKNEYESKFKKKYEKPQVWSELDSQIKFFSKMEGVYGGSLPRNYDFTVYEYWSRLHSAGLFPVNSDFKNQLNSNESVTILEQMADITSSLDPSVKTNNIFDNFKSFGSGNNFCNLGWGGTQKFLQGPDSKIANKTAYSVSPGGMHNGKAFKVPYFNWGWNYVVSSRSKQNELSYLFCLFATSPRVSADAIKERNGYFDPFMKSHYQDDRIVEIYGKDFLKIHYESLQESIPDFYVNGNGLYISSLKRAIQLVINGNLSPKRAMELVSNRWENITDNIGRDKQIRQWAFLKESYPEKLKEILK